MHDELSDREWSIIRPMLLADLGSDADWIRAFVNERGAWANIPPKQSRKDPICFSPYQSDHYQPGNCTAKT